MTVKKMYHSIHSALPKEDEEELPAALVFPSTFHVVSVDDIYPPII